tara:strand:+ start:354 stop:524 length:171 start_codon:yes stop_codon:yes gene_type:complete
MKVSNYDKYTREELVIALQEMEFTVKALCEIGNLEVSQTWWYELKNKRVTNNNEVN